MPEPPRDDKREEAMKRVDAVEAGLRLVHSRLEKVERTSSGMEKDLKQMKDQLIGIQSSMQEMAIIFRNIQEKLKRQAETRGTQHPPRKSDGEGARPGDEVVRGNKPDNGDDWA